MILSKRLNFHQLFRSKIYKIADKKKSIIPIHTTSATFYSPRDVKLFTPNPPHPLCELFIHLRCVLPFFHPLTRSAVPSFFSPTYLQRGLPFFLLSAYNMAFSTTSNEISPLTFNYLWCNLFNHLRYGPSPLLSPTYCTTFSTTCDAIFLLSLYSPIL